MTKSARKPRTVTKSLTEKLLKLQFKAIGQEYSPDKTASPTWFSDVTWTDAQEAAFIKAATSLLKRHGVPDPASSIMWWNLAYGFRTVHK